MYSKNPPFEVTNTILGEIAEIAELVGHVNASRGLTSNPTLRRTNRIRTIYSSLAIEQNTLSLEQVTAVLGGKRIIAPPKDIAEVKNAYEIYDMLDTLDPYSVDDLLKAHGVMTRGLVEESGCFRSRPVGVADKQGNILHFGTLPDYVPGAVMELLEWVRNSELHMLIKSCVFHYELELIHPFADGNGRIGRLWHTMLLTQWKPMFAWIPVESMLPIYLIHLFVGMSFGKGASMGLGIAGSLIAALMITGLGDATWKYIPWAWGVRAMDYTVLAWDSPKLYAQVKTDFFSGMIISVCCTVCLLIASLVWFHGWEGGKNSE